MAKHALCETRDVSVMEMLDRQTERQELEGHWVTLGTSCAVWTVGPPGSGCWPCTRSASRGCSREG